jgi:hypothetical protein
VEVRVRRFAEEKYLELKGGRKKKGWRAIAEEK